jgi:peptidoglycan/xylan/chitin deacetylase (PgdA/CDA1 family)
MSRIIKLVLSCVVYAATEMSRAARRLVGIATPPITTVLCYHHTFDHERTRFARQLDHLLRWCEPVPANITDQLAAGRRYVALTADDGWLSFLRNAVPEILSRRIPITIFLITGRLGEAIEPDKADRLVTLAELATVTSPTITLGSHTVNHARLTHVTEEVAMRELADSRHALSSIPNADPALFAFPFGSYNSRVADLCRLAGYRRVFITMPRPAFASPDEFEVGRIRVDPSDSLLEFHLKMMGAYGWTFQAIILKRRFKALLTRPAPISAAPR